MGPKAPIGSFGRFTVQSPALVVFIDAVMRDDNRLPIATRQNVLNLGMFVMAETFSLMTAPKQRHLANLIQINRAIATGLGSKSGKCQPQRAA
jgi:flagellar biosynthesis regulator FlaF